MMSLTTRKGLEYGRLNMKAYRKFLLIAAQHYNFPDSLFCERIFQAMTTMNPFYVLATSFYQDDGPLISRDIEEARTSENG